MNAIVERAFKRAVAAFWLISHHALASVGVVVLGLVIVAHQRPDLREQVEQSIYGWLDAKHGAVVVDDGASTTTQLAVVSLADADGQQRATATDMADLPSAQADVAQWIAKRYRVAPEPIGRLVQEAWHVGSMMKIEPTLILAIMAVESSFNPFAQSSVGAQGLMQVMTHLHDKKYERFGGTLAAFDPVSNLRVGVQVLKECIARAGSLHEGLRYYVGAAHLPSDGGYAAKVLAEHHHLQAVASGKRLSPQVSTTVAATAAGSAVPSAHRAEARKGTQPAAAVEHHQSNPASSDVFDEAPNLSQASSS